MQLLCQDTKSESRTETNVTVKDFLGYLNHLVLCSRQLKFLNYLMLWVKLDLKVPNASFKWVTQIYNTLQLLQQTLDRLNFVIPEIFKGAAARSQLQRVKNKSNPVIPLSLSFPNESVSGLFNLQINPLCTKRWVVYEYFVLKVLEIHMGNIYFITVSW